VPGAGVTPLSLRHLKEQERGSRRELILSTARDLFAERDFRSVTAREIAKRAGLSPGTIYRYYDNLDELFLEVLFIGVKDMCLRIDREFRGGRPCSVERFSRVFIEYLNDNMAFYQMMSHFMLGGKLTSDATKKVDASMRALIDRLEAVVRGAGFEEDTRLTAHALYSALNGLMISYARYPGRSLKEIRRHTLRLASIIAGLFRNAGVSRGKPSD